MDVTLLATFAVLIVLLIIICTVLLSRRSTASKEEAHAPERATEGRPVRRAAGQRNVRRRMQATASQPVEKDENGSGNEGNDEMDVKSDVSDQKIGTKKRAKLAAKAEKKVQREAAEQERETRKKIEQLEQEERDKQHEKEREEELRKEEAEKAAREEKERKEYEEYLQMKEAFSVEEEGYDEDDAKEDEENLLIEFLQHIKQHKVVVLEDLAARFSLKTASVVDRIQELQANGNLTGVIDDRGKFIYISQDELEAVAKFVKQRGRVNITDLAENSNRLISLSPGNQTSIAEAR